MRHKPNDMPVRHEVIQRYCPKCGDNVIMLRTYGEISRLQCMSYDLCDCHKDEFCDGILAEGGYADEGRLPYSVIGIGINLYKTDFDGELAAIATDLYSECGKNLCRATLAAGIIKELWYSDKRDFTGEYRRRSFIIGERVTVLRAGESYEATAISIGDDGALTVRTENGEERKLISGEVSIRRSLI